MQNERIKAIGIALLVLILMSFDTVLIKLSLNNVSPYTYIWLSLLIGILAMVIYTFVIKRERVPWDMMTKKVWLYVFQIGFFNFVTGRLNLIALDYLPATTNAFLFNFIGFITMGMSFIILKETPSLFQIFGAGIAFAGLRVFFQAALQGGEWIGIVLVLISITGIAYTNNIARKLSIETKGEISNNIISTLAIILGGSLMIITCIVIDGFPPIINSGSDWLVFLYTGIITNAVGLTVWNLVLRTLRSYEASVLGASMVIWTSIFAYFILDETITVHQLIGIAMLLLGISLVQLRNKQIMVKS
ncbi:MAG: DMT family transporter [Pelolinea sp.]|nr:DMT family transporter [Pelolinea sp.]